MNTTTPRYPTTKATLAAYARVRHNADEATHCACGASLSRGTELAHVSGWYGDYHLVWRNGRLLTVDACCARCRVRLAYTPQGCDYDPAEDRVTYVCPALQKWLGLGGASQERAWEVLVAYAKLCARGEDRVEQAMDRRNSIDGGDL